MNKECVHCKLRSKVTCSPSACPLNRGINSIQNLNYSVRLIPNDKKDKPTYGELEEKVNQLETNRDELIEYSHKRLGFLENCVGGDVELIHTQISVYRKYLKILERGKGGSNE